MLGSRAAIMHAALLMFALSSCVVPVLAAETVQVPYGKQPVMLDGKLGEREWSDARTFMLADRARVHVKQRDGFVWIAIEWLGGDTFTADLYLAARNGVFDLHSSAKIGERRLKNGAWPDPWKWWNNEQWVATCSRVDDWKAPVTFMPQKVREFQIARERFAGGKWEVLFELMYPGEPSWKTFTYPASAKNTDPAGWITLQLD